MAVATPYPSSDSRNSTSSRVVLEPLLGERLGQVRDRREPPVRELGAVLRHRLLAAQRDRGGSVGALGLAQVGPDRAVDRVPRADAGQEPGRPVLDDEPLGEPDRDAARRHERLAGAANVRVGGLERLAHRVAAAADLAVELLLGVAELLPVLGGRLGARRPAEAGGLELLGRRGALGEDVVDSAMRLATSDARCTSWSVIALSSALAISASRSAASCSSSMVGFMRCLCLPSRVLFSRGRRGNAYASPSFVRAFESPCVPFSITAASCRSVASRLSA